ncbi:MAG: hypothetical protein HF314_16630 [Ignavibacteria bacterium]|jgi:hypothetical protein|nr:hypothetical protein [Ignavibacteria bacterium]MCU7504710.1 hypothetical protein [Ignavibacteria bacterium]MCU7516312.1 hypothetical protein [Ignavibacteria bacterium]
MKTKILLLITAAVLYGSTTITAQTVESVSFSGGYSGTFSKRSDLQISSINGAGGEVEVRFNAFRQFRVSISGGYSVFSIDQNIYAMFSEWNWRYWKRYFGDINDPNFSKSTQWVQSILKDSSYSAGFDPVQKMDAFPVFLTGSYEFSLTDNIALRPYLGAGVIFYSKRLYVEETWKKTFAALDDYVYGYSYRNMAENVTGNPYAALGGFDAVYKMGDLISLNLGAKYAYIFQTKGKFGYDNFPMKDMFSARLGITFNY